MKKKDIRKKVIALRDNIPKEEQIRVSKEICKKVIQHPWFCQSKEVLCFASFGSEVDTLDIMENIWERKKRLFLPIIVGNNMKFYCIDSLEDLEEGYMGIREPKSEVIKKGTEYSYDSKKEEVLIIMPGVAFDKARRRIGYGKGYYDRFLEQKEVLLRKSIGIGFSCQLVPEVPEDIHDVRPNELIIL